MKISKKIFIDTEKPYAPVVQELRNIYDGDIGIQEAFDKAVKGVKTLPNGEPNPWTGTDFSYFCSYFNSWYYFLPYPGSGLSYIGEFCYFYYDNEDAFNFLNKNSKIYQWTKEFIKERGAYMDTDSSTGTIEEWLTDPNLNMKDFVIPNKTPPFSSFNEFFIRELRPGARPVADAEDDSVVVSPADAELNMLNSALTADTQIDIKGNLQLNVAKLLDNSTYADKFEGGTALSCILLPSCYHHFHSPVTGEIIESKLIEGINFGLPDAPMWFHDGNVGDSDADFSIFEQFHRGYFVIKTGQYGLVAMVPVGLNTISTVGGSYDMASVNIHPEYQNVTSESPRQVYKGEKLGYFKYGGSLNILLFEPGRFDGIKVLTGARIGKLNHVFREIKLDGEGISGEWMSDSPVSYNNRGYAEYYTFAVSKPAKVMVDVSSDIYSTGFLLQGNNNPNGKVIAERSDPDTGSQHFQIIKDLGVGAYSIEISTWIPGQYGKFQLKLTSIAS
ncbi:putative phosphatidylserine decarboxylase [Desulfonema limicola]|uniref:Phosphatidylserine decarboxylase n=1 Tax=Desulfonema limicola TaxID=45656 RepID=A0A975GEC8_9BACT|nr:phosphatidylserine decarboxylase [Desulfonema limicola]QTA77984.1 putative phosphatidylserine decarboxylase [Desulfonema limicola]